MTVFLRRACALLLLLSLLALTGCGGGKQDTRTMLADFLEEYGAKGGTVYASGREAHSPEHMTDRTAALLFADAGGENPLALCTEYAIYLSPDFSGGEIGFFRCRSGADAARVRHTLSARLARLVRLLGMSDARLLCYGNDTVLLALPDTARAEQIIERIF